MKVSDQFIQDLRYLRDYYGWNSVDVTEVKKAIKEGGASLVHYFTVLADAHRKGYEQNAGNGFVRLQTWCAQHGLPDPFTAELDPAALDAAPMPERRAA